MRKYSISTLAAILAMTAGTGIAQMTSRYNSYDNVTVSMDANGSVTSATVTSTLEGNTLWNGYPPCHHTGTAVVEFGGVYSSASVGPVWPNYYMDKSAYVTLPGTASCFTGTGCQISDSAEVDCECNGLFYQSDGSQSGGSSNNWSLMIQGLNYMFVGADTHIPPANFYVLSSKAGGAPQPTGGQFTVTSNEPSDSFHYGTLNGMPTVTITTTHQSTTSGDRQLAFSYASGDVTFTIYKYVTARQFAYVINNNPTNLCTSTYGIRKDYVYTVYTHPDHTSLNAADDLLHGTPATEAFDPDPTSCGVTTGPGALDTNDQFTDQLVYCSNNLLPCSMTTTQTLSVGGFQVRTNTFVMTSTGFTYTSNGPTQ